MVEAVQTKDLTDAIDATKKSWRRDTNNLALSGQIKFSSIMRTFVDTPEKMMELATAQSKTNPADDRPDPAPREDFRASLREERKAAGRDTVAADRPVQRAPERAKEVERPKATANEKPASDPKTESDSSTDATSAPAEKPQATVGKSFRDEIPDAPQAIEQTAPQAVADAPVVPVHQVVLTQATSELAHGARTSISAALVDKHFARVGEDIHDAAHTTLSATVNDHIGPQSTVNSLKDEQASDLSNRLSGMGQFSISVDAGTNSAKAPHTASTGFGANVNFGQFDGLAANDPQASDPSQGTSNSTTPDQKAPSTHGNVPADRAAAATSPQDLAAILGQAVRAQVAMTGQAGAQAGADTKIIAQADAIQAIGPAAAPTGPAQLSQANKAAPATPPKAPEKPQTPAEQIAVKIRQAIGDGNDKINIKLNPHELGRVEVRLELHKDGGIVATVLAERQDTLDMLQKDARGLERALNDAGLRTDPSSLSFGLRGDTQRDFASARDRKGGSNTRNSERGGIGRIDFGETAGLAKSGAYQRSLGANKGVDIRV